LADNRTNFHYFRTASAKDGKLKYCMLVNDDDSVSTSLLAKLQFQDVTLQAAACITDMQKFKKKTLKNR
jgi:transposase-like protein